MNKAQDKNVMRGILVHRYRITEPLFNTTVQHHFEVRELSVTICILHTGCGIRTVHFYAMGAMLGIPHYTMQGHHKDMAIVQI